MAVLPDPAFRFRNESHCGIADFLRDVRLPFHVTRGEPGEEAEEIMRYENLAVAPGSGADPDGRYFEGSGNRGGHVGLHELEDDGKTAGALDDFRIGAQRAGFLSVFAG